jgi:glutathione peroxidase-family protein
MIMAKQKRTATSDMSALNFKATDIHGNKIELQNYKGKYVLINFGTS